MEFREHTLENGLEIVAECNPRAYSTALGFFVRAGSRDETDEVSGVSHFLEHMAFKGTPKRTAADVNRELDEMGSYSNARTDEERTVYHASILPEFQDRTLELLSDIMRPSLRAEDFDTEKQVILEEILMYEDQPPFGGHERIMALHFGQHPLSRSVLGTVASVGALTPDQMRTYHRQRYSPNNMVLVAAGNVDFERLVAVAREQCGAWQPCAAPRQPTPAPANRGFHVVEKETATQQYVLQIAQGPAAEDADRYAGRTLATIIGDDSGSRFYWDLIDTGRAEFAGIGSYEYQGAGMFTTFLCCAPLQTAENLQRVRDIHREAEREGLTAAELQQAKNKISAHVILQAERPGSRLFAVGVNWLQRREYRTVREIADAYAAVTLDDVVTVMQKYPLSDNTTLAIGPLQELTPP